MRTPPLLQRMMEVSVGELIVRDRVIVEPLTNCRVADSFPTRQAAVAAAKEMNEVADWLGVLKTIAEGRQPNCREELERIAKAHGGGICANDVRGASAGRAATAVAKAEGSNL